MIMFLIYPQYIIGPQTGWGDVLMCTGWVRRGEYAMLATKYG
jgi:hypothetical protein